jgi:DNA-binding transcriptional LysR family regulator
MAVHTRDLHYFLTLAEELNFTRAATRLYITQPALSKQIRALERALGAPLLDRSGRDIRLSPVGEALVPHAQRVLAEWRAAQAAVEEAKLAHDATLVVGISTSMARHGLLSAIHARFRDQHPEARIVLRQVSWDDPTAGLAGGTSDLAFVYLPIPDADRFEWTVVAEEPLLVALPAGHRLADREVLDFDELLDEPFIALPASTGTQRDHWLGSEHRHGRPALIGAEMSGVESAYESLVTGAGICLLAAGNAPGITRGDVVTVPVDGLPPGRLALAWRADRTPPLARAYVRSGRETVDAPVGA